MVLLRTADVVAELSAITRVDAMAIVSAAARFLLYQQRHLRDGTRRGGGDDLSVVEVQGLVTRRLRAKVCPLGYGR